MESLTISVEYLNEVLEDLYELRGERSWWKNEPRCTYQQDYAALEERIQFLEGVLDKHRNEQGG